jgi:hypothetical protein
MKVLLHACAAAATAGVLLATASVAFAQNSPGVPGGILQDQFRLAEHPQMPFGVRALGQIPVQQKVSHAQARRQWRSERV